ncbi:MAG: peptidoglycan editing factor PgeF [Proteobacteria bacterium]|nr:peptidoglycan editing factor PgeF [Pseudomonadota bacterium]
MTILDSSFLIPEWPAPAHIKALVTTRDTGDMAKTTNNRELLSQHLKFKNKPVWLEQIHSNQVVNLDMASTTLKADASFTKKPESICVVLTADCLPVLITNRQGNAVAAIHAGWRGLQAGIIDETIAQLKVAPADLLAWLGPAIGPDHFEVGAEVRELYISKNPDFDSCFTSNDNGRYLADLYKLARINLQYCGVNQVFGGGLCTYCEPKRFYSYRREKSDYGRMASLIWMVK